MSTLYLESSGWQLLCLCCISRVIVARSLSRPLGCCRSAEFFPPPLPSLQLSYRDPTHRRENAPHHVSAQPAASSTVPPSADPCRLTVTSQAQQVQYAASSSSAPRSRPWSRPGSTRRAPCGALVIYRTPHSFAPVRSSSTIERERLRRHERSNLRPSSFFFEIFISLLPLQKRGARPKLGRGAIKRFWPNISRAGQAVSPAPAPPGRGPLVGPAGRLSPLAKMGQKAKLETGTRRGVLTQQSSNGRPGREPRWDRCSFHYTLITPCSVRAWQQSPRQFVVLISSDKPARTRVRAAAATQRAGATPDRTVLRVLRVHYRRKSRGAAHDTKLAGELERGGRVKGIESELRQLLPLPVSCDD